MLPCHFVLFKRFDLWFHIFINLMRQNWLQKVRDCDCSYKHSWTSEKPWKSWCVSDSERSARPETKHGRQPSKCKYCDQYMPMLPMLIHQCRFSSSCPDSPMYLGSSDRNVTFLSGFVQVHLQRRNRVFVIFRNLRQLPMIRLWKSLRFCKGTHRGCGNLDRLSTTYGWNVQWIFSKAIQHWVWFCANASWEGISKRFWCSQTVKCASANAVFPASFLQCKTLKQARDNILPNVVAIALLNIK